MGLESLTPNPNCTRCDLQHVDACTWGNGEGKIIVVKEVISNYEATSGEADTSLLDFLKQYDMDPNEFYVTSLNKCKGNVQFMQQRNACLPYLQQEIEDNETPIIITMGDVLCKYFLDTKAVYKSRGIGHRSEKTTALVLPTFSLDDVKKKPWLLDEIATDFHIARSYVNREKIKVDYKLDDIHSFLEYLPKAKFIAFDIETDCKDEDAARNDEALSIFKGWPWLLSVSLWSFHNEWLGTYLFSRKAYDDGVWDQVGIQISKANAVIIAHNGKFDLKFLTYHCVGWENVRLNHDTAILHHLINENTLHNLNRLQWRYLPSVAGTKDDVDFSELPAHQMEQDVLRRYAAIDSYSTGEIFFKLVEEKHVPLSNMLARASTILAKTERDGCYIDEKKLKKYLIEYGTEAARLHALLFEMFQEYGVNEFNPNSPTQVAEVLYETLKLPIQKDEEGNTSTDDDTLLMLSKFEELPRGAKGFITFLREYRKAEKIRQTLEGIKERLHDGAIRTEYEMYFVVTGRMSSRNPNLQNIPRDGVIKELFIPKDKHHVLIEADYSQAEYRLAAHMSGDEKICSLLREGADFHDAMMQQLHALGCMIDRAQTKTANFAILYGAGIKKVAAITGLTEDQVLDVVRKQREAFPEFVAYIKSMPAIAKLNGNVFVSPFGRLRHIPYLDTWNKWWRSRGERQIINSPIQGAASDLTLNAMVEINKELHHPKVVLTVHDSIVWEIPKTVATQFAARVKEIMEHPDLRMFGIELKVPLVADVTIKKGSWRE